jgi:predicted phosphoribosyltransferase
MRFKHRQQAGLLLARKLKQYKHEECIVYALPRGGVPIGAVVAEYLNAPLDLIIARKIGHPQWPEYAVCAVTEYGVVVSSDQDIDYLDPAWLNQAIENERLEARRRRRLYFRAHTRANPKNKIAIIVDDGVATGLTIRAAINELIEKEPARIILAVPVGPADVLADLAGKVDDVISLISDSDFAGGVGAYYEDFDQTSDQEVIDLLAAAERRNKHFNAPDMR